MPDKPQLSLLPPNPTVEQIVALYKKLTGKEPTQAEIDEIKTQAVMGQAKPRVIQPDALVSNADWPKRTKDVPTPNVSATGLKD